MSIRITPRKLTGGASGVNLQEDVFIVGSDGQTVFTLTQVYSGGIATASVNGVDYDKDVHFTISGTTATWLNTLFELEVDERITFTYSK